jgi:glyoxylase-like metal-dependent hydrolase (beta-lactamase superfamily II)
MTRAIPLTAHATWWPSTLFQTTTLELRRADERLLVDPGVSLWEIEEVVAAPGGGRVAEILLTHADWDHVTGIPALPDARVWASQPAAERITSGSAATAVARETAEFYIEYADLARLRVDQVVDTPAELSMGDWPVVCTAGHGGCASTRWSIPRQSSRWATGRWSAPPGTGIPATG